MGSPGKLTHLEIKIPILRVRIMIFLFYPALPRAALAESGLDKCRDNDGEKIPPINRSCDTIAKLSSAHTFAHTCTCIRARVIPANLPIRGTEMPRLRSECTINVSALDRELFWRQCLEES